MNSRTQVVRNRLLSITRNTIPYIRELRMIAGSISAAVVMQQLDYWFARYPDGFYKFLEPTPNASLYRAGQSWCEELCFTKPEFRTAFDRIGYRWASKTQFDASPDRFKGKFYASYVDRRTNLTFYFRNHELVDLALDQMLKNGKHLSQEIKNPDLQEMHNPDSQEINNHDPGESTFLIQGNQQSAFREIQNPHILYTETTENTSELLPPTTAPPANPDDNDYYFPEKFSKAEKENIIRLVSGLDPITAQDVIDEAVGLQMQGKIQRSIISLVFGLAKRARERSFHPAMALKVAEQRQREQANREKEMRLRMDMKPPVSREDSRKALAEVREILKTPSGKLAGGTPGRNA